MHPDSLSGGAQSLPRSHPLGAPALCASLRAFCPSIVLLLSFSLQHLSDALRDLVTLTFEVMALVGDVGLTLPFHLCTKIEVCSLPLQIWHNFGLSISRPGDLDLWSLTLKLLYPLFPVGWATFLPILCFCDFFSRLMGQHLSDARDLVTLTFDFGGHGACRWCESSFSIWSLKFVSLPVRKILRI